MRTTQSIKDSKRYFGLGSGKPDLNGASKETADAGGATDAAEHETVLRVAANSRSLAVAGAIAGEVRRSGRAIAQAIGRQAVHRAIKAVAMARGYLALEGIDVVCIPAFVELGTNGVQRTAVRFTVEPR